MRLLDDEALRERGFDHSKSQRNRLIRDGRFPAPIYVGGKPFWPEHEIEAHVRALIAERDSAAAAKRQRMTVLAKQSVEARKLRREKVA
jgi:predicted DNA-binding transcriptional regulator AlpA